MEASRHILAPLPAALARERGLVLHRALRGLPVALLEPLLQGLRRHADSLVAGRLVAGSGGCAVGVMLRELADDPVWHEGGALAPPPTEGGRRGARLSPSIYDRWPEITKRYPRLPHIEIIFDATCEEAARRTDLDPADIPSAVGLWMAAETQSEINMRHVEEAAADESPSLPARVAPLDEELFAATVERLMELRPGLGRGQATTAVESLIGARRLEPDPLFLPSAWEREVELQEARLAGVPEEG